MPPKLVAFDIETTGLDVENDRIVEISFEIIAETESWKSENKTYRLNPEVPIPPEASAIHGIKDEDVKNCLTFRELAGEFWSIVSDAILIGYNIKNFDLPFLAKEFERNSSYKLDISRLGIIDVYVVYAKMESRDLQAAYKFYLSKPMENAHSAKGDAQAAAEILKAQLNKYPELPRGGKELAEWCFPKDPNWITSDGRITRNENGEAVLSFGKNKNIPLRILAKEKRDYLEWIMTNDFSEEVKKIILNALRGD